MSTSHSSSLTEEGGEYIRFPPPPLDCTRHKRTEGIATTEGVEFEQKVAGLAALRARRLGLPFELASNVAAANPFDDVVLRVGRVTYFLQLKTSGGKKPLTLSSFKKDKNFPMKKYFEFFLKFREWHQRPATEETLDQDQRHLCEGALSDCRFVIYTTRRAWDGARQCAEEQDEVHKKTVNLLNTGHEYGRVLRFSDTDSEVWGLLAGNANEQVYQTEFLPFVRVFCGQTVSRGLDSLIKDELKVMLGDIPCNLKQLQFEYLRILEKWRRNAAENYFLNETWGPLEWIVAEDLRARWRKLGAVYLLQFEEKSCANLCRVLVAEGAVSVRALGVPEGVRASKVLALLDAKDNAKDIDKAIDKNAWVYVDTTALAEFPSQILIDVCRAHHCKVLVLDVDRVDEALKDFVSSVAGAVKVVELSSTGLESSGQKSLLTALGGSVPFTNLEEEWRLTHLTTESQDIILGRTVIFQGDEVPLRELEPTWPRLREEAEGALLGALAKGEGAAWVLGAPPELPADAPYIPRTLEHGSALDPAALALVSPSEHLALQGFSAQTLRRHREALAISEEEASDRWTTLDKYPQVEPQAAFQRLCEERGQRNVHWVQCVDEDKMALVWRCSRGDGGALSKWVLPVTDACAREPTCVHASHEAARDAAAWGAGSSTRRGAALLVGEPGAGKSNFLKMAATEARKRARARWAVFVPLLKYSRLLDQMPPGSEITVDDLVKLLVAAAGVAAPASSAAAEASRRCLEAALLESGDVALFVDDVDELCPAFKDKALRLLELVLQKTKTSLLWVSSRPEVEASLQRVLGCSSVSFASITREEQLRYLRVRWSAESRGVENPLDGTSSAQKVLELLARYGPTDRGGHGLLAAPLHLQLAADILAHAHPPPWQGDFEVHICDLFSQFTRRKQEEYFKEHFGGVNLEKSPFFRKELFLELHYNCAVYMLVANGGFKGVDIHFFEKHMKEKKYILQKGNTGMLWMDEEGSLQFVHFSFVEYFAACWLSENIRSSETARAVVRALYARGLGDGVRRFLDWMLTEGCPLHRALLAGDEAAFAAALIEGAPVDQIDAAGRTALHVAISCDSGRCLEMLIDEGCDVNVRDLLEMTPLHYANMACKEDNLSYSRLFQLETLLKKGAAPRNLAIFDINKQDLISSIFPRSVNMMSYISFSRIPST